MKTCATCRFLGAEAPLSHSPAGFMVPDVESEHRRCVRIIHGNADGNPSTSVLEEPAVVTDGSGYAASLRVLPSFGCTLHELPKDPRANSIGGPETQGSRENRPEPR